VILRGSIYIYVLLEKTVIISMSIVLLQFFGSGQKTI